MTAEYDAIVIGARCGGSPTAMLLARKGYRVLLVDRASFPSDTLSCHFIHQPGLASLERWGLLSEVAATGCPPVRSQILDVGPFASRAARPPTTASPTPMRSGAPCSTRSWSTRLRSPARRCASALRSTSS